jgi:hypothetical protein
MCKCFFLIMVYAISISISTIAGVPTKETRSENHTNGFTEPLLSPVQLQKLPPVHSLPKQGALRLNMYKRCLFTGPCTHQEMKEVKKDANRAVYILLMLISAYALRRQYKAVQAAGVTPTWLFPLQWWHLEGIQQRKEMKEQLEQLRNQLDTLKNTPVPPAVAPPSPSLTPVPPVAENSNRENPAAANPNKTVEKKDASSTGWSMVGFINSWMYP